MQHPEPRYAGRLATYGAVATHLSLLSDRRLGEVVAAASPLGSGIGGRSAELDIDGTRVFVKRVPLTDLELRPENVRSTANLFGLPMFYQYGVGSAGFGAWRELAVHTMTTGWVLGNEYEGFPLMYHWRVLPDSPPEGFADEFGGIERGGRALGGLVGGARAAGGHRPVFVQPGALPGTRAADARRVAGRPPGQPRRRARRARLTRGWRKLWRGGPPS